MKKIVFTGGGTAGHIMPNIAIIEELHKKNFQIFYIGSNGMEKEILKTYKYVNYIEIPAVKFARSLTPKNLLIPFKLIKSIKQAKSKLRHIKPDLIFSKGGYVSIPVCIAGHMLKIPVLTHESDYTIGLANKIIAKKSKYLCCSFKDTSDKYGKNAIFTGSPIRQSIYEGNKLIVQKKLNIQTNKPIILIVGGSLGAQSINNIIWKNVEILCKHYTIIHIVGKNKIRRTLQDKNDYFQIEFASDIENYFAISDIVISRAGSNTIFELLALKKTMILVPLPKSNGSRGDQELNANYFAEHHIAYTIQQNNLNINSLQDTIKSVMKNKEKLIKSMSQFSNEIGNKKILEIIYDVIDENK